MNFPMVMKSQKEVNNISQRPALVPGWVGTSRKRLLSSKSAKMTTKNKMRQNNLDELMAALVKTQFSLGPRGRSWQELHTLSFVPGLEVCQHFSWRPVGKEAEDNHRAC